MSTEERIERCFRQEYGNLVSLLAGRIGIARIADIEDAVQSALAAALATWPRQSEPENPTAWLYTTARNQLLASLRSQSRRRELLDQHSASLEPDKSSVPETFLNEEIPDDLLRVLFLACDNSIPLESQLALALKILCGFSVKEIALSLFTSEANIYKRLARTRKQLQNLPFSSQELAASQYTDRLPSVLKVVYLLFNEGHLSTATETSIRLDLCIEAIRLATLLANHPLSRGPQSSALLALLHLHHARAASRANPSGGLILLEEQDRSKWNQKEIQHGLHWLAISAEGGEFSRYHAEAGIAVEHCLSPSFAATRWDRVIACYDLLISVSPSPLHILNRAVAIAEAQSPADALDSLEYLQPPSWLIGSYLWSAVLADLHLRSDNTTQADRYQELALAAAPTESIRSALNHRFANSDSSV